MPKRRGFNVFSLSFLDIMSCGFGAVILIFIIIQHGSETTEQLSNVASLTEVRQLESEIKQGSQKLGRLQNNITSADVEIKHAEATIQRLLAEIISLKTVLANTKNSGASNKKSVALLKSDINTLEEEVAALRASVTAKEQEGGSARAFIGDGERQYLTGLNLGGRHILLLIDASASMLDQTIVNIIRRRNMRDDQKRAAEKWQRAIRTIEWLMANLPPASDVQLIAFSEKTTVLSNAEDSGWINSANKESLDQAVAALKRLVPNGGTSLHSAFAAVRELKPRPDNVFLLSDSLPTMAFTSRTNSPVSSAQRVKLFDSAVGELPIGIPVNIILFPMEGDPIATPKYWRLAQLSGGSFLSPAKDWP